MRRSVLFITGHRLGDVVIAMAALAGMMARYPQAQFTIACGPAVQDLFAYMPRCERVIVLEKRSYNRHWVSLWWRVMRRRWAAVVDLRSSPLAYGVWAGKRYSVRGGRRTGLKREQHARALGLRTLYMPTIWLGDSEKKQASQILPETLQWIAFAPTAGTETKMWPAEKFAALAKYCVAAGMRPVLFYGPGAREARLAAPLRALLPEALDLGGRYNLGMVAALLARCRLFVGSDSGLMHLAAALNVPTLGLFGPSYAEQYAPSGHFTKVVLAPGDVGAGDMQQLGVDTVWHAVTTLYNATLTRYEHDERWRRD